MELIGKYKGRSDFPLIPMVILPSYYTDNRDKEVAAIVALMINDDGRFERIQEFHEMLGGSPWVWFKERGFVRLSIGNMQNKKTGGVENWKISQMIDKLWNEYNLVPESSNIGECIMHISDVHNLSYEEILEDLFGGFLKKSTYYKIRLLLLILLGSDGFSLGIWDNVHQETKCPIVEEIGLFIRTWFPDYKRYGSIDEAIGLFCLNKHSDFYYAFLAYSELQKIVPKECSRLASIYRKRYDEGRLYNAQFWTGKDGILPKIDLNKIEEGK